MTSSALRWTACAAVSAMLVGLCGVTGLAGTAYVVSQKDQSFRPGQLSILRGETITVVNDDGDLLHHSYVESAKFSFDSGDQAPGARLDITFPVSGTFLVLCGIHPRMKMTVRVE